MPLVIIRWWEGSLSATVPQGRVFAEDAAHDAVGAVELLGDLSDAPPLVVKASSVQFPAQFLRIGAGRRAMVAGRTPKSPATSRGLRRSLFEGPEGGTRAADQSG